MKRELLSPLAVMLGAAVAFAACSSDGPDLSAPSTESSPDSTVGTPTTEPTASPTTDPDVAVDDRPAGAATRLRCRPSVVLRRLPRPPRLHADRGVGAGDGVGPRRRDRPDGRRRDDGDRGRRRGADCGSGERSAQATVAPAPVEAPAPTRSPGRTPRRSASTRATSSRPTASTCTSPTATGCASSASPSAEVVDQPELPNGSHQLLLDGDRLLVVTTSRGRVGRHDRVAVRRVRSGERDAAASLAPRGFACVATRSVDDVARLVISTIVRHRGCRSCSRASSASTRNGPLERNKADHRRVDGRGLAAALVRRGGRRIVRPDASRSSTATTVAAPGRVRRARADVDRVDRPARRRRPRSGRPASCRPATRVRLDDNLYLSDR